MSILRRDPAQETAEKHYHELEDEVLGVVRGKLRARKMHMDSSDLQEAYCLAWHGVTEMIREGEEIGSLTAVLVTITWRRAVDEYREQRVARRADIDIEQQPVETELDDQISDRIRFKRFLERVKHKLNDQEKVAVSLCLIHGYSRPEAAKLLGLSDRRIQKIMDGATKKIGVIVDSINARGCGDEEWARLLHRYALGLVTEDERDHARVIEHINGCDACQRYVRGIKGLAAITPPIGWHFMPVGGHESVLAHLENVFGSHTAASASTAAAGTASATGGGGLIGSLSGGAALKGAAVLAIAAGATAITVGTSSRPRHQSARHQAVHSFSAPVSLTDASGLGPVLPHGTAIHSQTRRHSHSLQRSPAHEATQATKQDAEFGFERTPQPPSSAQTPAVTSNPPASSASVKQKENCEFSFEC